MAAKRFDLVALGEALIELSRTEENVYRLACAGDVLNSLFYASRLGLRTGLITATGQDIFEQRLHALLEQESINADCVLSLPGRKNGVYFIHLQDSGEPLFHFLRNDSAATQTLVRHSLEHLHQYIAASKALLFSAIGLAVYQSRESIGQLLMRVKGETRVYFDTNFRAPLWEDPRNLRNLIDDLAAFIDVILVTDSDDRAIFGPRTHTEVLEYFHERGISSVVYRMGAKGAWASDGVSSVHVPAVTDIEVRDTTAAGDAFNAGFIAAQLEGRSLADAVALGNATAAQVIQHKGGIIESFDPMISRRYAETLKPNNA